MTSDIIDTFTKYPEGVTTEDLRKNYKELFRRYSNEYSRKRKKLTRKLESYIDSGSDTALAVFPAAKDFIDYLNSMDDKYNTALQSRVTYVTNLVLFRGQARAAKKAVLEYLNSILGVNKLRDVRAKILHQIVLNALDNPSLNTTLLDSETTPEIVQEVLRVKFNKARQQLTEFSSKLESSLSIGSLADLDVDGSSSFIKKVLKKMGQLNRTPIFNKDSVGANLEDYWREKVRKKFGGDLPFCDEVDSSGSPIKVMDSNGVERYAKATEVIDLGGGRYILKTDKNMDLLRKSLRNGNYDAY